MKKIFLHTNKGIFMVHSFKKFFKFIYENEGGLHYIVARKNIIQDIIKRKNTYHHADESKTTVYEICIYYDKDYEYHYPFLEFSEDNEKEADKLVNFIINNC